jgi:ATP-dependent DNA helicase RecQ
VHDPLQILKQYWGFDQFRHLQQDIIHSVLNGDNTLALLPTGGGKSLCYQLPAMCKDGLCLVISPLIALMKDQVDQLKKKGIKAYALYTGLTHREIDIILDNCIYGEVKLLYASPERIQTDLFIERIQKMDINLLAVDEAHCISQWGYDFRPSYLKIAEFRQTYLPKIKTIALTATATEKVVEDIVEKLELNEPNIYKASFHRDNLALAVRKVEDKESKLVEILNNVAGSSCVYVRTRRRTKDLTNLLLKNQISADYYHAGLSYDLRMKKQDLWQKGLTRVIVATNAFGMGVDKANVRSVIHFDLPDTLEAYYQEAGRAGRDGKKAYAVIIYHPGDKDLLLNYLENNHPSIELLKRVYQSLANYYKIAVGSNMLSFFDFDITDFCQNFNLHYSETYHTIRKLQEEGLIELNESFYHPSKVTINLDNQALYTFQIANAKFDPILKTILRLYGGELFTNFVRVSENQIARMLNTTTIKIKNQLNHLNDLKVITYDRMRDKPQLAFITSRYDVAKLPLNITRLNERRQLKKTKLEAIFRYVEKNHICRTSMILDYFGEVIYEDCGHCDICLEKKKNTSKSDHQRIREMLLYELHKGPKLPEELTKLFDDDDLILVEEIIRDMNDQGDIKYDNLGRLFWKNAK